MEYAVILILSGLDLYLINIELGLCVSLCLFVANPFFLAYFLVGKFLWTSGKAVV